MQAGRYRSSERRLKGSQCALHPGPTAAARRPRSQHRPGQGFYDNGSTEKSRATSAACPPARPHECSGPLPPEYGISADGAHRGRQARIRGIPKVQADEGQTSGDLSRPPSRPGRGRKRRCQSEVIVKKSRSLVGANDFRNWFCLKEHRDEENTSCGCDMVIGCSTVGWLLLPCPPGRSKSNLSDAGQFSRERGRNCG